MQISAPVQGGNSGSPVVDETGSVVGVVVSKLDAKRYADIAGEITQNINFAIRGEIAKLFLSSSGEKFQISAGEETVHPVTIAKRAQSYTALITCLIR